MKIECYSPVITNILRVRFIARVESSSFLYILLSLISPGGCPPLSIEGQRSVVHIARNIHDGTPTKRALYMLASVEHESVLISWKINNDMLRKINRIETPTVSHNAWLWWQHLANVKFYSMFKSCHNWISIYYTTFIRTHCLLISQWVIVTSVFAFHSICVENYRKRDYFIFGKKVKAVMPAELARDYWCRRPAVSGIMGGIWKTRVQSTGTMDAITLFASLLRLMISPWC